MSRTPFITTRRKIAFVVALVCAFGLAYIYSLNYSAGTQVLWGVTYTPFFAQSLGLNPNETFRSMLSDLRIKRVRIGAYWSSIEQKRGTYDFSDLDWYVRESTARDVKLTLAVGERLPRWPECHVPTWAQSLSEQDRREYLLKFITATVEHYKDNPTIMRWQVENEPLLNAFGECAHGDKEFLKKEIALVRSLDDRPIVVTDSGELSMWGQTIHLGDYFGTTLYKRVWAPWGYFNEVFPAAFYNWRARLWGKDISHVLIVELQGEPWLKSNNFLTASTNEDTRAFSIHDLRESISFARATGFSEIYLWGVEYWYYMKDVRGDPAYFNEAQRSVRPQ